MKTLFSYGIASPTSLIASPTRMYKLMSWRQVERWLAEIDRLEVSRVARGEERSTVTREGFLQAYRRWPSRRQLARAWAREGETWLERRDRFVARHLAQYRRKRTYRRRLALIAWAYDPEAG